MGLLWSSWSFSAWCCSAYREMKRGNIGLALGMVGRKIRSSLTSSVDLGLTGKDGVVHPSLTVRPPAHLL